jgi:uncharacterized membrane protein YccC
LLYQLARQAAARSAAGRRRVRARLADLNEMSLQIEHQLEGFTKDGARQDGDDLRSRVLRCEIAAESLAAAACAAAGRHGDEAATRARRARLVCLLHSLRGTVRDGRPFERAVFEAAAGKAGLPFSDELHWRFYWAAGALATEAPWSLPLPALGDGKNNPSEVPSKALGTEPRAPLRERLRHWLRLDDNRRQAIRATVASLGAMIAGHAISGSRWYWAVIAAFVVFTRAMTLGQAVSRAWERVLGTAAGVALGLVVAQLVRGSQQMELALLFLFVALGYYLFRASYTAFVLLFTAMLALLYELIGRYTEGVLFLRLEETLAGALSAILSAALILPLRTSTVAERNSAELLREAAKLLRSVFADSSRHAMAPPQDAVRALDRRMQALRQSLAPVTGIIFPAPKAGRRQLLHRLSVLVYCVRHLYAFTVDHPPETRQREAFREMAVPLAANIDALVARLENNASGGTDESRLSDMPQRFPRPRPDAERGYRAADTERITTDWLWRSNEIVRVMYADASAD